MPDDSTQDIILDELRALRAEFNAYARGTGERLSALETDNHSLMGNGQPGRVTRVEMAVASLVRWRWWLAGAAAGGSGVISILMWVVLR